MDTTGANQPLWRQTPRVTAPRASRPRVTKPRQPAPPVWEKWISKEDRDHIEKVAKSVADNVLPASVAFGAVNTQRIAAEAEYRATWLARMLQGIRNVGVLAPIMVTWISFALASSAYSLSVITQSDQSQSGAQPQLFSLSLLQQWEQGFTAPSAQFGPILVPLVILGQRWFTFSHFAIFDAALILSLVIITIFAQWNEGIGMSRARETMRGVEIRLFNIAENRNANVLAGKTIEEKTQASFEMIATELERFDNVISEFTISMRGVPDETLRLVSARLGEFEGQQTTRLTEAFALAANAQTVTEQAVMRISTSVQELNNIWISLGNLITGIGDTTRDANKAVGAVGDLARTLGGDIQELSRAQGEVAANLSNLKTEYRASVERLERVGNAFDQTTQMQEAMRDNLETMRLQAEALVKSRDDISDLLRRIESLERAMGIKAGLRPKRLFGIFPRR